MSNINKSIIKSLLPKETLNPKIWELFDDPVKSKIKNVIRLKLLGYAYEFIKTLEDDIEIEDIVLLGSNAGFEWSAYSDLDVHILIDFSNYKKCSLEKSRDLLKKEAKSFNDKYDVQIKNSNVECYIQDTTEENNSKGVYSLIENKWISYPEKTEVNISLEDLEKNITEWKNEIFGLIKGHSVNNTEISTSTDELLKRLRKYRKEGLEHSGGEFSIQNLTFKYLRRTNIIKRLIDKSIEVTNKTLSLETLNEQNAGDLAFWAAKLLAYFGTNNKNVDNDLSNRIAQLIVDGKAVLMNDKTKNYNEATKTIQLILIKLGYGLTYDADGIFGKETKRAVIKFQKDNNLPVTGIVETATMKKMLTKLKGDDIPLNSPKNTVSIPFFDNAKKIYDFFIEKGLTPEQTSGIMGNLQVESGFNPEVHGDYIKKDGGYTSFGIAQWHKSRKRDLINFCSTRKLNLSGLDCQLNFLWFELTTSYKGVFKKIKSSKTPEDSAHYFADEFEIPANKDYSNRKIAATKILKTFSEV